MNLDISLTEKIYSAGKIPAMPALMPVASKEISCNATQWLLLKHCTTGKHDLGFLLKSDTVSSAARGK